MNRPWVQRAAGWLRDHQNQDGGWGEDIRSYADDVWAGVGPSTASQTAWAVLGLMAVDMADLAVERGIAWLVGQQRADGGWDEDAFTGTGFPLDFMIKYHYYRLYFPVTALGRYGTRNPA